MTTREMRARLIRWGRAERMIENWREELDRIRILRDSARDISGSGGGGAPGGTGQPTESKAFRAMELEDRYDEYADGLERKIEGLIKETEQLDDLIMRLDPDLQQVLILRYRKQMSWTAIGMRTFVAARTAQRMEYRAVVEMMKLSRFVANNGV